LGERIRPVANCGVVWTEASSDLGWILNETELLSTIEFHSHAG
jgi:hypothetical protein